MCRILVCPSFIAPLENKIQKTAGRVPKHYCPFKRPLVARRRNGVLYCSCGCHFKSHGHWRIQIDRRLAREFATDPRKVDSPSIWYHVWGPAHDLQSLITHAAARPKCTAGLQYYIYLNIFALFALRSMSCTSTVNTSFLAYVSSFRPVLHLVKVL